MILCTLLFAFVSILESVHGELVLLRDKLSDLCFGGGGFESCTDKPLIFRLFLIPENGRYRLEDISSKRSCLQVSGTNCVTVSVGCNFSWYLIDNTIRKLR